MSAELRCKNSWETLIYARSKLVHAAANAGIDAIDVPYLDLEDPEGMKQEAILARDLGFSGKGSIHPKQIPILNEVFTPEPARVEHAQKILKAFLSDFKVFFSNIKLQLFLGNSETNLDGIDLYKL